MKERPILMSAPMARALLAGTKSQTRRIVKLPMWAQACNEDNEFEMDGEPEWPHAIARKTGCLAPLDCPYGEPGDRLWVREAWAAPHAFDHLPPRLIPAGTRFHYRASEDAGGLLWRSSIHMPRWASRINLDLTGRRVQRLQDISAADCISEGIGFEVRYGGHCLPDGSHFHCTDPRQSYFSLWEAISGAGSVEANPWIWAVSFKRVQQ